MKNYYQYRLVNNPSGIDAEGKWKNTLSIMLPNSNDDYVYNLNLYCEIKNGGLYDCITGHHLTSYGYLYDDFKNYNKPVTWLSLTEIIPATEKEVEKQIAMINNIPTLKYCYMKNIAHAYNEPMRLYQEKQNNKVR